MPLSLQVVICHNHMASQDEINHALVHELVHAYDHCRGASIDWSNCNHHACSEVCQSRCLCNALRRCSSMPPGHACCDVTAAVMAPSSLYLMPTGMALDTACAGTQPLLQGPLL